MIQRGFGGGHRLALVRMAEPLVLVVVVDPDHAAVIGATRAHDVGNLGQHDAPSSDARVYP